MKILVATDGSRAGVAAVKESSGNLAQIVDKAHQQATQIVDKLFTGELDAQYVMDRTTINNVADDRAWAFSPDNVVDRSPAFRLAFPFGIAGRVRPCGSGPTRWQDMRRWP